MKRNLTYLAILIALLGFTYVYQELGWWGNQPKSILLKLDYGDIDALEFKSGKVDLKPTPVLKFFNQQRYNGDVGTTQAFWAELNKIIVRKELSYHSEEYKSYFSPLAPRLKLRLSNLEEIEFVLGEMVPDSENFYWLEIVKNKSRLYIAEFRQIANGTEYYEAMDRYRQITALFELPIERFFFRPLFPENIFQESTTLSFQHLKKKAFQLHLHNEQRPTKLTDNFAINGMKIKSIINQFRELKGELLTINDPKGELLTTLEWKNNKGEVTSYHLYHVIKGEAGFYVQKNQEPFWIRLPLGKENIFLMNEMDFWLKTLFSKVGFPKEEFKVKIIFPSGNSLLYTPVEKGLSIREKSHFKAKNLKVLNTLNYILFGHSVFSDANRVSAFEASDLKIKKPLFELRVGHLKLFLSKSKDEILLMNPSDRYTLHYYLDQYRLAYPLGELEQDYL